MPFVEEQGDSENYNKLQRRQLFVWFFLVFFTIVPAVFFIYISYQFMGSRSGSGIQSGSIAPFITPLSRSNSATSVLRFPESGYFLYGSFSSADKKYRIFKVFYDTFAKQELFSFLWNDASSQPTFSIYGDKIIVFPTVGKGFFISQAGKMLITDEFIPPDAHFSVSPDNKWMFYFKYLSSIGTTSLTLRNMTMGKDVYSWPVSSSASQLCDFTGWSGNNTKAYCLWRKGKSAAVKVFDAHALSVTALVSSEKTVDAKFYPQGNLFFVASADAVSLFDTNTKQWRELARASLGSFVENMFFVPNGSGVLYTEKRTGTTASDEKIYSVALDGSAPRELGLGARARLLSITPDSRSILFESPDKISDPSNHYFIARIDGTSVAELYLTNTGVAGAQFIGWFL